MEVFCGWGKCLCRRRWYGFGRISQVGIDRASCLQEEGVIGGSITIDPQEYTDVVVAWCNKAAIEWPNHLMFSNLVLVALSFLPF